MVATGHTLTDATLARAPRATFVSIPTYEGSGVAVHPSVYFNPSGWNGYKYWMAMTPYPSPQVALENPSIVASNDGNTWVVPAGVTNPIEPTPGGAQYNSDPFLYMVDGTMYCFWRSVLDGGQESIYYRTSPDGVTWANKTLVWNNLMATRRPLAPCLARLSDGTWVMYAVDIVGSQRLVRYTAPAVTGPWSAGTNCVITGNTGVPWHVDIHNVNGEWQALVMSGGGAGGDVYAAVSNDGINFTASANLLARYAGSWDSVYYKSCFIPAVKDGLEGWDAWIGSGDFAASGQRVGRTFVAFDKLTGQIATLQAQVDAAAANGSDMLAARVPLYPWIAGDSFSRADNAGLGNAESGQTWTGSARTFKITSKAASPTSAANTRSVLESGTTDHWPSIRIDSAQAATAQQWLIARFADANNFYRLGFASGGNLVLEKVVAGAVTGIGSFGVPPARPGLTLSLRCTGTTLQCYANSVLVGTITDSALATGTQVGIQATDTTAAFRNFTVKPS